MEEKDINTGKNGNMDNKTDNLNHKNNRKNIIILLITRFLLIIVGMVLVIISIYRMIENKQGSNEFIIMSIVLISILSIIKFIDRKIRATATKSEIIAEFFFGKGISILKCDIVNKEVKAGDNIFLKGIGTTSPYNVGILNVHIVLEVPELLTLKMFKTLNSKIVSEISRELKSQNVHDLGVLVGPGELFNMKVDKATIFKKLTITETYLP